MNDEFWSKQWIWPRDFDGYVFLGRAVHEIGRHLFPDKWTGDEPAAKSEMPMQARLPDGFGNRVRAYNLLKIHRPEIELPPLPQQVGRLQMANISLTQSQWDIAREISDGSRAATVDATSRFAVTQEEIIRQCCSGILVSAYRAREGGAFRLMPRDWWNTERNYTRFTMCQMNPHKPFSAGFAGDDFCWIFLTRDSLDRYPSKQPAPPPDANSLKHVSPYLRLMLATARDLDIRPDNQPKKSEVEALLREKWPKGIKYSDRLADAMATLLREPESQLGKAKTQTKKPQKGVTQRGE